ncbi:MAG: TPR end-of-group domain-containing protein [Stenomitos frigidus ULC029]
MSYLQRAIKLNPSLYRALAKGDSHFQSLRQTQQLQILLKR